MADVRDISIVELATLVHVTPERLLEQLQEAGVAVTDINQKISPEQKRQLLAHLQKVRGEEGADWQETRENYLATQECWGS